MEDTIELTTKYQCDHSPRSGSGSKELDLICRGCLRKIVNQRIKLLEFVKSISNHFNLNESELDFMKFYVAKEHEAEELLKEIGEL